MRAAQVAKERRQEARRAAEQRRHEEIAADERAKFARRMAYVTEDELFRYNTGGEIAGA